MADLWGVEQRTVQRWEAAGKIPRAVRTDGRHRRWDLEQLAELAPPTVAEVEALIGGVS